MRPFSKLILACGAALTAVLALAPSGEAHKAITSKFTYAADVYPVFLNRCGHCHVTGGVAPMSLLTYEEAFPWAESLRAELLEAGNAANDGDFITTAHRGLSARELDIVMDWAVGGTPEGANATKPAPVSLRNEWADGAPDLILQPSAAFDVPADAMEVTQEFVLPTGLSRERSGGAIDVLPGTPAVVRDVTISLRTSNALPRTIATWTPRQSPALLALDPPLLVPPGAEISARVHYKKTWKYEGLAMSDRSAIGLYFADR